MPGVFISYESSAVATARQVAARLRADGREVWLDVDLPPHRAYADVIREHLEAADAVVVLWSAKAAASEWVRAEADLARNQHKLVQATLDGSLPPMPFNQVQCANLKGWRGGVTSSEWLKIAGAVAELCAKGASDPVPPQSFASHRPAAAPGRSWMMASLAALGVILVLAATGWLMRDRLPWASPATLTRIAVLPFRADSHDTAAADFASGLGDQLQSALGQSQLQVVSHEAAQTLVGPKQDDAARGLGVRLILDGAVANDGKTLSVTTNLEDVDNHVALWSETVSGPADSPDTLKAHVADRIMAVLNGARRAFQPKGGLTDPKTLALYIKACAIGEGPIVGGDTYDALTAALMQVTAEAPDFAPAHSDIAQSTAIAIPLAVPEHQPAMRQLAASEAARALALDPKDSDAYVAQALLLDVKDWSGREALLNKAVAAEPDSANANGFMAKFLCEVGRIQACRQSMAKAVAEDPFAVDWIGDDLLVQAGASDVISSDDDAAKIMKTWGSDAYTWQQRLNAFGQLGRWDQGIALLDDPVVAQTMPLVIIDATRTWFTAMKTRAPDLVAKAKAFAVAAGPMPGANLPNVISSLSGLGAVDEAFTTAARYEPQPVFAEQQFLFFQLTAPMRRDPRFLTLAARLGLLNYWRQSGNWPDFCKDPTLPYKCQ